MGMSFRFRQFSVEDEQSSMRIGTDAVLLGAWTDPENRTAILDIGTGCGVIALMMAQKCDGTITAIDIDEDSAHQASGNFRNSRWNGRMNAIHCSFQEFSRLPGRSFDLIMTNPPYFRNSLKSPLTSRNFARHDDQLNTHDLLTGVSGILCPDGKFCLILPAVDATTFQSDAKEHGLFLVRQLQVKSKPGTNPKRIAMEFAFSPPGLVVTEEIFIRREDNSYTDAYRELTKDFYIEL
jgi:tRNA1Val (adenine37-N6)-methyltransferase